MKPRAVKARRPFLIGLIALAVFGAVLATDFWLHPAPVPVIPAPPDLEKLDPQLRDYLRKQLEWVRAKPSDPARHATLGIVFAANELWGEARQCFSNVTRLNPREPLGHLYVAVATQQAGDYVGALQLFRQVADQFPDFAPGCERLGTALLKAGQFAEAAEPFRRLIRLAPDEWRGYAGLGEVKLRQNDFGEAVRLLEKARAIEPKARPVHHLLGLAYRGMGRTEDADWELRQGLNSEPTPMPDAWGVQAPAHIRLLPQQIDLASDCLDSGQPAEALRILNSAARYHSNDLTVLQYSAVALRNLNRPEQSRRVLERMLSIDERSVNAHVLMADICLDVGRTNEALTHAQRALALGPDLPQPYLVQSDVLFALGRKEEGLAARQQAFQRDPRNASIAVDIGDVLLQQLGNPREAERYFKQAVELDPTFLVACLRLAETDILLHQYADARRYLEQARKLDPQAPDLARLQAQLSEQIKARP